MATAVRRTISLPFDLVKKVEEMAAEEGKTLSVIIEDALRIARRQRLRKEGNETQGYWSRRAKAKGIVTGSN